MLRGGKTLDGHLVAAGVGGLAVASMGRKAVQTTAAVPAAIAVTGGLVFAGNCKCAACDREFVIY